MKCTGSVNLMKCTGSVVLDFGDQNVARMFLGTGPPRKIAVLLAQTNGTKRKIW